MDDPNTDFSCCSCLETSRNQIRNRAQQVGIWKVNNDENTHTHTHSFYLLPSTNYYKLFVTSPLIKYFSLSRWIRWIKFVILWKHLNSLAVFSGMFNEEVLLVRSKFWKVHLSSSYQQGCTVNLALCWSNWCWSLV